MSRLPDRIRGGLFAAGLIAGCAGYAGSVANGPSTTIAPYYVPSSSAYAAGYEVRLVSLATVGDTNAPLPGDYRMVGIPDGLGAYDNGDGTFSLVLNHELRGGDLPGGEGTVTYATNAQTGAITATTNSAQGIIRSHGGKGSFVSRWTINSTNLGVVSAGDLMRPNGLQLWDFTTGQYRTFDPLTDYHISRLCSADLASVSAFFNPASGKGTTNRIFLNGEEDGGAFRAGQGGRAFAHLLSGPEDGKTYELAWYGKYAWENVVASPWPQDQTIAIGLEDAELTNSHVYVHIGQKQATGMEVEKAGLHYALTYGIRVEVDGVRVAAENNALVFGTTNRVSSARFKLFSFGDIANWSEQELETNSLANATVFQRVEDGAWDPTNPNDFYFVTTGRVQSNPTRAGYHDVTNATRLWRMRFDNLAQPELGGTVELMMEGPAGQGNGLSDRQPVMMDNLCILADGSILIQEDPGNYERAARIWIYVPTTGELTALCAGDARYFNAGGNMFQTLDEEASGIIDASAILGAGWVLFDVQNHSRIPGELVERGQLVAMHLERRQVTSASTVQAPEMVPSPRAGMSGLDVFIQSLVSTGDPAVQTGGYRLVGTPDGLGAYDNGDGSFTLLVNHELAGGDLPGGKGTILYETNEVTGEITISDDFSAQGITRTYGGKGAFVSEWVFDKATLQLKSARDFNDPNSLNLWNGAGGWRKFEAATDYHLSQFCSADLPAVSAFFNPLTGKGTTNRIFMNGEEDGFEDRPNLYGRAFAHVLTGADKRQSYELVHHGKHFFENNVASPYPQDLTVVMGLDDGELDDSQLYVYIGEKRTAGNDVEKAGLVDGGLWALRVLNNGVYVPLESNELVLGSTTRATRAQFVLHSFGDASTMSGPALEELSKANATSFFRVEDGAWDPTRPNDFYFVTTGRVDRGRNDVTHATRLWRVSFDDLTEPQRGGFIEMIWEGPAGTGNGLSDGQPVNFDNLAMIQDGSILLQEDPGDYARLAKIWWFDPVTRDMAEVATSDPNQFTPGTPGFITRNEEGSGIIDASEILGPGWFLLGMQIDRETNDAELVSGGQLMAMHITESATPVLPGFLAQPGNQTVQSGGSVTASAAAVGTGPFTYQWFWNGVPIPGATFNPITLYNLPLNQAGDKLTVVVTGPEGKTTSNAAIIKTNPADATIAGLQVYPTITLTGQIGGTYRIEYKDSIESTNSWKTLADVKLTATPQRYMDESGAQRDMRVYRVVTP